MTCHICGNDDDGPLYWSCCGDPCDGSSGTAGCSDHDDGEPTCGPCGAEQGWWTNDEIPLCEGSGRPPAMPTMQRPNRLGHVRCAWCDQDIPRGPRKPGDRVRVPGHKK